MALSSSAYIASVKQLFDANQNFCCILPRVLHDLVIIVVPCSCCDSVTQALEKDTGLE